jgi:hypothetical protein
MKLITLIILTYVIMVLVISSIGCGASSNKEEIETTGNYIVVENILKPIIYDSIFENQIFSFFDNVPSWLDKSVERKITDGFKFFNPVKPLNLKVERVYESSQLRRITYVDTNKIKIVYILKPHRCLGSCDGFPAPTIKIDFETKSFKYDLKTVAPKKQIFKTATETVFVTEYDLFPSGKWELRGWSYQSSIKIYRNNSLYRQYKVTDEIPELRNKVVSYIASDKKLVVEVLEQF